jgi:type III pantothenate kinase
MKNLVIDYGNTAAKVGIFQHQELVAAHTFLQEAELQVFLKTESAQAVIFSSVANSIDGLQDALAHIPQKKIFNHHLPLPIINRYATPETLGVDRLAGVCGARVLFPAEACLVLDAGTCLTYDFIDDNNIYHGGAISPGLAMRLKAMHDFTARLPLAPIRSDIALTGNSTITCLQSGAFYGMLAEIEGMVERYKRENPELRVILCGGDTHLFENRLKGAIFAVQNLVLRGLNSILLHNVSH